MPILGLKPTKKSVYPAHFDIEKVIRPNILSLQPYRCARDDYSTGILVDANENSLGHSIEGEIEGAQDTLSLNLNRYPDPSHPLIKSRIAALRGLGSSSPSSTSDEDTGADHIFLGVGSDEVIDLLMRVCVVPGRTEKILTTPPTYGMYGVCAQVNDIGVVRVPLELSGDQGEGGERGRFSAQVDQIKKTVAADPSIKLIFLCSPGNPTGTLIPISSIRSLLEFSDFKGIVVVDEAYIDFTEDPLKQSAVSLVKEYANVCVLQTLSKGFGLAAIRLGIALAQPPLIQVLTNTKAPYNISTPTAHLALSALSPQSIASMRAKAQTIVASRAKMLAALSEPRFTDLGVGKSIGGNDANFVLIPILENRQGEPSSERANKIYRSLAEENGVVVRYRGNEPGCAGCLRITIGSEEENKIILQKLEQVLRIL
ncbi:Histidinol-phosphate aminotransferase [Psilocybe cubensis]|uniref:histidinol-phosphate transaminase n=2 Tax=Psilocybe cubensis TaxID=181762 RepID=A0A8H8CH34_PSICU|nr:Histidinol-phosphate aminotransferase [Psilocybe cubensis]KAH9477753.1 Histidinol-phosphate aminotransferase [Psilocybe cubensis]